MAQNPDKLANLVLANDKLLKAMVALLAMKDEHLLDELRIVFRHAIQSGSEIGQADEAVWAHIRHEMKVITDLVDEGEGGEEDGGEEPDESEGGGSPGPRAASHH